MGIAENRAGADYQSIRQRARKAAAGAVRGFAANWCTRFFPLRTSVFLITAASTSFELSARRGRIYAIARRTTRERARSRCRWRARFSFRTNGRGGANSPRRWSPLELEQRFNKQQIFELYANEVYLGNRGQFWDSRIFRRGQRRRIWEGYTPAFHSGSAPIWRELFARPNYYSSADRHPERGAQARDRVLTQMLENKYITRGRAEEAQARAAKDRAHGGVGQRSAVLCGHGQRPFARQVFRKRALSQNFRVYTTLDPALQRAAAAAVDAGVKNVDLLLAKKYEKWRREASEEGKREAVPQVQIALVAT